MTTVKVDTSGKIYLPKKVREKLTTGEYAIIPMPNGDIILHKARKYTLKELQAKFVVTKPLKKVKEEILEEATRGL